VCVLERGREVRPGEYPNDTLSMAHEIQVDLPLTQFGSKTALFDLRVYDEINVAVGCGLGGTSLVNAAIALRPDPRLFDGPRWPAALRARSALDPYFAIAESVLKPARYPDSRPRLPKFDALERVSRALRLPFDRVPILVNFDDLPNGVNEAGVPQSPCVDCGDCVSGCNYGAKNTLLMNYLADARRHGAELYPCARVRHILPDGGGWRIVWQAEEEGGRFSSAPRAVSAASVVLAAGTLGSTEILLRSRAEGLALSGELGRHFSGNGDMIGLAYNADTEMNAVGFGPHPPGGRPPVGPCSTAIVDARQGRDVEDGIMMVDAVIPGAFGAWLPAVESTLAAVIGQDTDRGLADKVAESLRAVKSKVMGPYSGAIHNTLLFLVVAHDDARGRIALDGDRLIVDWPSAGDERRLARAADAIRGAATALGATFIPNPSWHPLLGRRPITGHPLGGCAMADDAREGVVDDRGRVYRGESGRAVHPGLFVMDGAVIPRSLGVNPLLAITAVAERCCDLWMSDVTP
jgi:cholesterol oxidase